MLELAIQCMSLFVNVRCIVYKVLDLVKVFIVKYKI